jgi:gliotoxin/aspirochlorine biosynthesis thioredoxin reductase
MRACGESACEFTLLHDFSCPGPNTAVSYHCLFCKGYEDRGPGSSGVLAISPTVPALAAHMAQNAAQLSETVTIYTNADEAVKAELDPMISVLSKSKFIIDTRKINRLTAKDESSVSVEFEDGSTKEERFLVHNPLTSPQGPFVGQLGLEVTAMGDIKADPPFFATNVQGVYAVGDCSTPYKVIPSAISSGCNAAVAAAAEVQAAKYAR